MANAISASKGWTFWFQIYKHIVSHTLTLSPGSFFTLTFFAAGVGVAFFDCVGVLDGLPRFFVCEVAMGRTSPSSADDDSPSDSVSNRSLGLHFGVPLLRRLLRRTLDSGVAGGVDVDLRPIAWANSVDLASSPPPRCFLAAGALLVGDCFVTVVAALLDALVWWGTATLMLTGVVDISPSSCLPSVAANMSCMLNDNTTSRLPPSAAFSVCPLLGEAPGARVNTILVSGWRSPLAVDSFSYGCTIDKMKMLGGHGKD